MEDHLGRFVCAVKQHRIHRLPALQQVAGDGHQRGDAAAGARVAAQRRQRRQRRQRLGPAQPVFAVLVHGHADADDEVGADRGAHRVDDQQREGQPVFEAAAPGIGAGFGGRGREGVHEVPVGLDLHPVHPGIAAAHRRGRVVGGDPVQVPFLGDFGEGPVRRLAHRRGVGHRQPIPGVVAGAPAQVGDLAHHRGPMFVDFAGELFQPGRDLLAVQLQVAEGGRAVGRDHRGAADHQQPGAALGALHVVGAVAVGGQRVLRVGRFVRGAHDAVAQHQVPDGERLEQRVGAAHGARPPFSHPGPASARTWWLKCRPHNL